MSLANIDGISPSNLEYVEGLYEKFLAGDKEAVPVEWQDAFSSLKQAQTYSRVVPRKMEAHSIGEDARVEDLINAYRTYGHLIADTNTLVDGKEKEEPWVLSIEAFGLNKQDLSQSFFTFDLLPQERAPLLEIIQTLKRLYCSKIGYEYKGLQNPELVSWLQDKIENPNSHIADLTINQKKQILQHLNKSELFESFLHTKYIGQKRFSLEGGETLIPMLALMMEASVDLGTRDFVIGMAHRGRLNVLSNILNKSYQKIFLEFDENYIPGSGGSGDVKYHKGYASSGIKIKDQDVQIELIPNPSHLESVDAVVEGYVFAKQRRLGQNFLLPILLHGDAAISGQGVVYETLQMSKLENYQTGGTLHFVINNHIGFTTLPKDSRSTLYCTDIARAFDAPVFHVNAEDPESCVKAALLALEIRQKFKCDVFIDLNCYRKYGHNEGDEPAFTQPHQYKVISSKKPIREIYRDQLIEQGILERQVAEKLENAFIQSLQETLDQSVQTPPTTDASSQKAEIAFDPFHEVNTKVSEEWVLNTANILFKVPEGFNPHKKIAHLLSERQRMLTAPRYDKTIDWGTMEILAYASVLNQGINIRIAGQDVQRGTFSHRHAILFDQEVDLEYSPLQHLHSDQGKINVVNSPLSEYAALGFEYGYSMANPENLTIWEAQFGDFANGAQIIFDQYISTAEQKWDLKVPIAVLLPHGYEGQGPEHSSARIERFLTLSGNNNWFIVNPSTPAQFFHMIRRHVMSHYKKPLIVFTPKALLRYPKCQSSRNDIVNGSFQEIIVDPIEGKPAKTVLCSGKIYYELVEEAEKRNVHDILFIRIEQLYPLDKEFLQKIFKEHSECKEYYWVQEEPSNMGAWEYIQSPLRAVIPYHASLQYIGRPRSSSPATGSYSIHKKQKQEIINALFDNTKQST